MKVRERDEQDWLRMQYQMAHHDIWWVKSQQMSAGNWTLLLLGAVVAVANLLGYKREPPAHTGVVVPLSLLSVAVVLLGAGYVWDLYRTLVRSRERAAWIVRDLIDPAFDDPKRGGARHAIFPFAITAILFVGLGIVLYHLSTLNRLAIVAGVVAWGVLAIFGHTRAPQGAQVEESSPTGRLHRLKRFLGELFIP